MNQFDTPTAATVPNGINKIELVTNNVSELQLNGKVPVKSNGLCELDDKFCDPNNPQIITFQDITSAAFMIKNGIEYTPCQRSHLSESTGIDLYLKKEYLQFTGSFKERGARYAFLKLSPEQRKIGVIAASLGNHAQGLSYHGDKLGVPVTVVMPITAPIMKVQKCRSYNASVVVHGKDMSEAKEMAIKLAKEHGFMYVNGYDHPHIIAGQGTIGLEIIEQLGDVDAVVVPVGGGGLIAGIAMACKTLRPQIKIIGVESEKCQSFTRALENKQPVFTEIEATLADGLAVPTVGYNAFATVTPLLDKMVVVKEEWIALAILRMVEYEKCVLEGAGAAGLAAILSGHLDEYKGKKVCLVLCGGNIDTTIFGRCLERGMAAEGRLLRFTVTVSDRPGGISELCAMMAKIGVSIKEITHERAWLKEVYSVDVKVVCETRNWAHSEELRQSLNQKYQRVIFHDVPMAINC